jgi:glycosyltransferase involved in cell wall biosynthesis
MQSCTEISHTVARGDVGIRTPLVSVGIPTFNRPAGLRRTLQLICSQTYPNLEILVSDNASPGSETERVVRGFSEADARVKYFRQPTNVGPTENFRFVLAKTTGDYFMWAADDDEWDASFIETCLAAAGPSCSVMTKFSTIFRGRNVSEEHFVPRLSPDLNLVENVENFLANMQPSLFYGLHPRNSVLFMLQGSVFDFYDCYFILRIILENGFRTVDQNLYRAGIDAPTYEVKYADAERKRLDFRSFLLHSSIAIARCSRLSLSEKTRLLLRFAQTVRLLRTYHAGRAS